ncbi:O-antigen ligase family protein [Vibrio mediterranei]|uniref:O-antigen ligase family protein n=1 Tax=Vibrio mediterranei TaxID=689 RepID=UPI0022847616|nr:O-antigen ligase family protein [Vibrio mediterranei]MCY9853635.1 O-antigen ligase family protein [Vibrio mediterranei]
MKKYSFSSLLDWVIIHLPFIIITCIIFNFENSKGLATKSLVILGAVSLFRFKSIKGNLSKIFENKLFCSTATFGVFFLLMHLTNDGNMDLARSSIAFLFFLMTIPLQKLNSRFLVFLCPAAIIVGYLVMQSGLNSGTGRWSFALNPIPYAYYISILAIFSLYFLTSEIKNKPSHWKLTSIISITAVAFGFLMIIKSETRGVWLSLFFTIVFIIAYTAYKTKKKRILFLGAISLFISMTIVLQTKTVSNRVHYMQTELNNIQEGQYRSSSGWRLIMWGVAYDITSNSPFLGTPRHIEQDYIKHGITAGTIDPTLAEFIVGDNANFHNQYLQLLVNSGLIGLMVFFFFYFYPIIITYSYFDGINKALVLAISSFGSIAIFFDSAFLHNHILFLTTFVNTTLFSLKKDKDQIK